MKFMGANEIRRSFLDYFDSKDHFVRKSFSLVPHNDKSLLLINAGMAPLKNYFLGTETPPKKRMATCQKCVRTGDIDNVGKTLRHATFFEMLGNFSFGDYFKKEAIAFAWEFIHKNLEMEKEKLWVTVYEEDDEAYNIWKNDIGIDEERIVKLGKEDNFWEIGNGTGPCGPCSEIYFDKGEKYGGPNEKKPGDEGDRFLEFWNLVFTQFDQQQDGTYKPLSHPNIDTGMGLERIACIMQNVDSIYDIDTMKNIVKEIENISRKKYGEDRKTDISIRIIADHMRAITFMVSDRIVPSNEGRGYVLRRLARRAIRHARLLGIDGKIFEKLANKVIEVYSDGYEELTQNKDYIIKILTVEEEKFFQTLDNGMTMLEEFISELESESKTEIDGNSAFKLYDTYGFPLELTIEIAKEHSMTVNEDEFKERMQKQKETARNAQNKEVGEGWKDDFHEMEFSCKKTKFLGYDTLESEEEVTDILISGELKDCAFTGDDVVLVFSRTPFYATSGGQVTDKGIIKNDNVKVQIYDVSKTPAGLFIHRGKVEEGKIKIGDKVKMQVDKERRYNLMRNHTATHLLHKALKEVLGEHVNQSGSEVAPDRLRFDFSHFQAMTDEEIEKVEKIVNENIYKAHEVTTKIQNIDDAKKDGAVALFDEKYQDEVRVVQVGDYSKELCGGTHVHNSNFIGMFKIISEGAVASGIRRIEAITGRKVYEYLKEEENLVDTIIVTFKTNKDNLINRADEIMTQNKNFEKELHEIAKQSAKSDIKNIMDSKEKIGNISLITYKFNDIDNGALLDIAQEVIDKEEDVIVVFTSVNKDKEGAFILCMMKDETSKKGYNAGNIIRDISKLADGKGGGRPNKAQGQLKDISKIDDVFAKLREIL